MKKYNKNLIAFIAICLVVGALVSASIFFSTFNLSTKELAKPNYLGQAMLGLIPTTAQCTHDENLYSSTDVYAEDKYGNKYVILKSTFGDEYCLNKVLPW